MNKLKLIGVFILLSVFLTSCLNDEEGEDREKTVEMTIYPETGYGAAVLSDIITQPLIFSDSDNNEKRMLVDIITEGFDFDYERGYEYTLKVKKVWMAEPPQDVSSIKYIFIELLSKKKVITEDSEEELTLFVSAETVLFAPRFPTEYVETENGQEVKIYDALYVKNNATNEWMALTEIEGFNYEAGYEYELNVKKITTAEPYAVSYVLTDVVSKTRKN